MAKMFRVLGITLTVSATLALSAPIPATAARVSLDPNGVKVAQDARVSLDPDGVKTAQEARVSLDPHGVC